MTITALNKRRRLFIWVTLFAFLFWCLRPAPGRLYTNGLDDPELRRPSWKALKQWELDLPQHNLDLPAPEGRKGRYVYFKTQIEGLGWNNQLNEVLMLAHLAHKVNRSYVFQDYRWNLNHIPWPKEMVPEKWPLYPQTPANALVAGPAVGGSWGPGDNAPRAISEHWWDTVCPPERRKEVAADDVKTSVYWDNANVILRAWEKALSGPENCIEVTGSWNGKNNLPQTIDTYVWGSDRILSIWEEFRDSPVSKYTTASHLALAAVEKNAILFRPRGPKPKALVSIDPFDRMLAIHVRRGDYKKACTGFGEWNSSFYGWNQLPYLPDRFQHPEGYVWGKNTPQNIAQFVKHCYPDDDFIFRKIKDAKHDYERAEKPGQPRQLDVLFLMTNEKIEWQREMKARLLLAGWSTVVTTHDLRLDSEEFEVGMTVDMEIARRAAVFIGNGWSSFTSSITHRRLVDGREPNSCRFY